MNENASYYFDKRAYRKIFLSLRTMEKSAIMAFNDLFALEDIL